MKVTSSCIVFESQRERDIFKELLREIDMNDVRPEIHGEVVAILDEIIQGLSIYDEEVKNEQLRKDNGSNRRGNS